MSRYRCRRTQDRRSQGRLTHAPGAVSVVGSSAVGPPVARLASQSVSSSAIIFQLERQWARARCLLLISLHYASSLRLQNPVVTPQHEYDYRSDLKHPGLALEQPDDIVVDRATGWVHVINPNAGYIFRFTAISENKPETVIPI